MATIIRPNQEFTTKATVSRGDIQMVSWIIFSGHNSDSANILQIQPKIGLELDHSFSQEGKYRIAAYQKEIQTKEDYQSSTELKHVDITVNYNILDGNKLQPKNPENFLTGDSLRKNFPAVFEAKFLIKPPTADELSRLQFRLEDAAGNKLNEGSAAANVFTFTPGNSNAKYRLIAEYTNEAGVVSKQTFSGTSKALSIKDITHGAQLVRPGTAMSFSITKTQFQFPVGSGSDLPESGEIKWNLDKTLIGTGKTISIPGNLLLQKKKYHIEAYVTSALKKIGGDNNDSANNDWHFEVKENIVEKIKTIKKPKAGLIGDFEIEEMTFKDYNVAKDGAISWRLTGPETGGGSEKTFSKLFKIAGEYTLSCTMGGRACKEPLEISIVAPIINVDKCKWIDKDNGSGNIITKAGQNQEVCLFLSGDGLDNENLTLNIYDDDTLGKTLVYTFTFDSNDKHKSGFYHPFTITEDIITKIKENGTADYGDLFFNIVRNNVDLQIKNGDKKLGEFLKVTLDPEIINAYFCDANDTKQILISALNGALYFKIYAINMVDKKVEINFLTESDAYWSWKDELELDDFEDIKSKFSDERITDTKTATFNKKGEIIVPVDLSKIGKPKNFIRLNAMVKIIDETNKGEAQGFYMIHKDLTLLYPPATLPNLAENKGAVMVGREQISGGENKSEDKCPRCEDEITLKIIEDAFQVYSNQKDFREKIVSSLNKFIKQRKDQGKDLHLNTCLRKAHFFAQVAVETLGIHGDWTVEGKMNHSVTSAKSAFGDRAKALESKGLLSSYCNDRPQERLLNYMYARGNGYDNGNGIESSGDGWKFRGRGLKQITGRGNYNMISGVLKDIFPAEYNKLPQSNRGEERLESHPEKVEEIDYAVITAIAYWEKHEIWKLADKITSKSNSDDDFKSIRKKVVGESGFKWKVAKDYFQKTYDAFRVSECQQVFSENSATTGDYNLYKTDYIKKTYSKVMTSESKTYKFEVYKNGVLEKSYTLEKSEHGFFNFPESGVNWGRYGTRDSGKSIGGDNWAKEECVAALLGFFYSVKESAINEKLFYNDISSHDGVTNLGHETHKTGKDIDIRYPGCTNSDGEQLWTVAKQYWGSEKKLDEIMQKIYKIAVEWNFVKNYQYKTVTNASYAGKHANHFHIGLK